MVCLRQLAMQKRCAVSAPSLRLSVSTLCRCWRGWDRAEVIGCAFLIWSSCCIAAQSLEAPLTSTGGINDVRSPPSSAMVSSHLYTRDWPSSAQSATSQRAQHRQAPISGALCSCVHDISVILFAQFQTSIPNGCEAPMMCTLRVDNLTGAHIFCLPLQMTSRPRSHSISYT